MTETTPEPSTREMRAWLREHRPELGVGARGFLSKDAVAVYREAHGLPVED
jgi:hypothetical protein